PIYGNPYRTDKFSSREIRSTDNIRVRDITFGYNIPAFKKYAFEQSDRHRVILTDTLCRSGGSGGKERRKTDKILK
ncbi:MAG: hypothetical protein IJR51_05670, partial [Clostridia bacterium]|nr:hypothetical protein [Clostridia bacterium]